MNINDLKELLVHVQKAALEATKAVDVSRDRDIDISMKLSDMIVDLDDMASDIQSKIGKIAPDLNPIRRRIGQAWNILLQVRIKMENSVHCNICEKSVSEDETEQCSCGRIVCWDCSKYHHERDTGAQVFDRCATCDKILCESD